MNRTPALATLAFAAVSFAPAAIAHPGHVAGDVAFLSGLAHPLLGADHLLAMLAVGLWAARFSGAARWALPAAFIGFMLIGALLGSPGAHLPAAEQMIAASVFALGLAVSTRARIPLAAGAAVVAAFAFFHGYAHVAELPADASFAAFAAGMLAATALLHGTGILLAVQLGRVRAGLPRLLGGAVALAGAWLLVA
jgi:urease accessory protein